MNTKQIAMNKHLLAFVLKSDQHGTTQALSLQCISRICSITNIVHALVKSPLIPDSSLVLHLHRREQLPYHIQKAITYHCMGTLSMGSSFALKKVSTAAIWLKACALASLMQGQEEVEINLHIFQ